MKTILLIDDDLGMLRDTSALLEQEGYDVVKAEFGERAVEFARSTPPDLVICDITLPMMDGHQVLHEFGRDPHTAEIPFIFLSEGIVREKDNQHFDPRKKGHVSKPIIANELLRSVEERLKHSSMFRKNFPQGPSGMEEFLDLARGAGILKHMKDRATRELKVNEIIFQKGDLLQEIPYIMEGKVRAFTVNKDGKEFTTALYGTGDLIGYQGLLEQGQALETTQAMEASKIALIPLEELLDLLRSDHDVSMSFIKLLARDGEEKRYQLLQLAYASIRQRVAQSLLRLQERYGSGDDTCIGVRISREDLASVVGTATESLIRCLSDLRSEKLISVEGREICLLDEPGLHKLART